jgi:hypothetical protein
MIQPVVDLHQAKLKVVKGLEVAAGKNFNYE